MSRTCMVTGKKPMYGNKVSHSNRKSRRRQSANIQKRRFWSDARKSWVNLTVSTAGIRIITKRGVDDVLRELERNGVRV